MPCKACEQYVCLCSQYERTSAQLYRQAFQGQHAQQNPRIYDAMLAQASTYGQTNAQQAPRAPEPHPKLPGLTVRLARLLVHRQTLETYSQHRMEDKDRHAVSDAANDLRELECEIRCVEEMIELVGGSVA